MIVDPLLIIFGAKLCQYQHCDAVVAVLRGLNLVNMEIFSSLPQIDQKKFIRHNFLQVLISVWFQRTRQIKFIYFLRS